MHQDDFDEFAGLMSDVFSLKGQVLTSGQKAMFFRALARYPLEEIRAGLDAHICDPKRGTFLPMPADVIAQIEGMVSEDGRPGVEEAWATAFRATDEAATIVWTDEISEAFGVARPMLLAGDEVAARMAFKEVYNRLLAAARARRTPPRWAVTLGHDLDGRDAVLLPHVQAGRLSADLLLGGPAPRLETVLSLPAPEGASEGSLDVREKAKAELRRLRDQLAERKLAPSLAELDAEHTKALKAEAAALVRTATPGANDGRAQVSA